MPVPHARYGLRKHRQQHPVYREGYRDGVRSMVGLVLGHRISELPGERPYLNRMLEKIAAEIRERAERYPPKGCE